MKFINKSIQKPLILLTHFNFPILQTVCRIQKKFFFFYPPNTRIMTFIDMKKEFFSKSEYSSILSEIQSIYENSQIEGDSGWNRSILYRNWRIGKTIANLESSLPDNSTYGKQIIQQLSQDLKSRFGKGFSSRNLWNFKKFHKLYPKAKINPILSWSHYSILITIDDPKKTYFIKINIYRILYSSS